MHTKLNQRCLWP